jgi:NAD(P)H-hydrate epimerase
MALKCAAMATDRQSGCLELLSNDEMVGADRAAVTAGVASLTLMENAGRVVADVAATMMAPAARVAVLCGPGNNGGDGFVAARVLKERGYAVRLACTVSSGALKGDAGLVARRWTGNVAASAQDVLTDADLIVDALFGTGLSRAIDGVAADMIAAANAASCPILAVDVPSGLDGTSGEVVGGGPIMRADRTVTFFRRKTGHLLMPGRALCGPVVVADIGIPAEVLAAIAPTAWVNAPSLWRSAFPASRHDQHKYTRGHAVAVSGPPESTGAARLGARGALRAGAGLVTVASPRAAFPVNAAHLTAIILKPFEVPDGLTKILDDKRKNALLIGPGCSLGAATRRMVEIALGTEAAVVLDADALMSFVPADDEPPVAASVGFFGGAPSGIAAELDALFRMIAARDDRSTVLTPHEGEFKRLFGDLEGSKLDRARAAAVRSHAVIVLKGPDTVIAHPDGRAAINENAPPWLATAGSGDVLAGFITGLTAQGMSTFEAACSAVWLHGECANTFGPGLIAEDIPETLPAVLKIFYSSCVTGRKSG